MENLLLFLMNPVQMALAGTSTVLLVGMLLVEYFKVRYLPAVAPALLSVSEQRRMWRAQSQSCLELEDLSGQFDASARLMNISLGGICFASALKLEEGSQVEAKLRSSKDWLLHLSGRIVWLMPEPTHTLYGLAIQTTSEHRPF
jgi:hypothetical protein